MVLKLSTMTRLFLLLHLYKMRWKARDNNCIAGSMYYSYSGENGKNTHNTDKLLFVCYTLLLFSVWYSITIYILNSGNTVPDFPTVCQYSSWVGIILHQGLNLKLSDWF
jgi:hypothetical protein